MANLPVVFDNSNTAYPALPAELMQQLAAMSEEFKDFAGGTFRRIKARRMDFQLIGDGGTVDVPANELIGVMLATAPYNHCIWYAKSFTPGQEPDSPDLVWIQKTPDDFPAALPKKFHSKIVDNGREHWGFQILRRTVWALARRGADGQLNIDYDRPYILDLSSMSMFGKGAPENNMYKLSGLVNFCKRQSSNAYIVNPCMFLTQIALDTTASVTGPLMFRPQLTPDGRSAALLPTEHIAAAMQARNSQEVQDLLTVREKLDYPGPGAPKGMATGAQVAQLAEMPAPAPVAMPVTPVAPVAPAPAPAPAPVPQTVVQVNQPVSQTSAAESLLAQAQAALSGGVTYATPAAAPAPAPTPAPAPAAAAPSGSEINDLLAMLS